MSVALPDPEREWVEEQVRSGDYTDAADYVRDLIRHDRDRHRALVDALIVGENSGVSTKSVEDIIAEGKAKYLNGGL